MSYETVILEKENGVATLIMNAPKTKNSFSEPLCKDLNAALDEVNEDDSINVLIITGSGNAFNSGGDMKETLEDAELLFKGGAFRDTKMSRAIREEAISPITLTNKLYNLPKPTIAAINGYAIGAGYSFALAADIRLTADDAKVNMTFVKRGFVPDGGGTFFLTRLAGIAVACEVAFTGDFIDAEDAMRMGLTNRVVPKENLMKEAKAMAQKIADNPTLAVRMIKQTLEQALFERSHMAQARLEQRTNRVLFETEDSVEGIKSFMEKREPKYTGKW
ncbi:enoyl-CoA hydratase/isomerase family protein [Thermodesulfobacteriota bacterium]